MIKKTGKILLIGNPNSGKSSLFNCLTGTYQKVANYPGVTTEKKSGQLIAGDASFELIDLPGCYSLYPNSIDERVVISELVQSSCDLIIFVADASNLHRSLLLYTQLADCKIPIIMALNMVDELTRKGEVINYELLAKEIDANIYICNAKKNEGLDALKSAIFEENIKAPELFFGNPDLFRNKNTKSYLNYREWHRHCLGTKPNAIIENIKRKEIIDRFNKIEKIIALCMGKTQKSFLRKQVSDSFDKFLLHPIFGYGFMLLILVAVFQILFTLASYPMDWIDGFFVMLSEKVSDLTTQPFVNKFMSQAIIPGVAGVLVFIPQIALLFLMNTILEESGYLARMAFLMDRFMRKFGMGGKSILPLLSGNACAIPAIASTRAIPTHKERLITILSIPFMTCSARLPVYTLLITVTIPSGYQALTLLGLYLIGLFFALLLSYIISKNLDTEEKSFLIMELPPYRFPSFRNIYQNVRNAVIPFVKTAGKFIFTISILLWFLASYGFQNNQLKSTDQIEDSFIASIGHSIEPAIKPLGYDWKIGVSLFTSFAAREVFVSTLATLYHFNSETDTEQGIITKIKSQTHSGTNKPVFDLASGVSLLLFYAFALQCFSTLAAIRRETGTWKYAIFSFWLMFALAYGSAFIAYQVLS
jgi:ferrous iron transport protein B